MTPVERYKHLTEFWLKQIEEANQNLAEARKQYSHWSELLDEAETAKKLEAEE